MAPMTLRPILAALLAAPLLGACATTPEADHAAQCPRTDWYAYGLTDGQLGQPPERADAFFAGCRAVGVEPDLAAYRTGRAAGLREFCTAENGYRAGVEGREVGEVCPRELAAAFEQGYARGRDDRPSSVAVSPTFTVGIGTGGYRRHSGIGAGIVFGF